MEQKRQTITPSLTVHDATAAIEFYTKALGATVDGHVHRGPGDKVLHSELLFGEMKIFVNDEFPDMGAHSPKHYGGSSITLQLRVADVDGTYNAAVAAGATSQTKPNDAFWGDRYACVIDPYGHVWGISAPTENLTEDQVRERGEKWTREHEAKK